MQTGKGAELGRHKCGENSRIRGSKGLVVCKWNTCLAMSLSLHSMLYMCVQSKMRPWDLHVLLCVCAAGVSSSNMPVQLVSKEAKCAQVCSHWD